MEEDDEENIAREDIAREDTAREDTASEDHRWRTTGNFLIVSFFVCGSI